MGMKTDLTVIRDTAAEATVLVGQNVDDDVIDRLDFIEIKAQECIKQWERLMIKMRVNLSIIDLIEGEQKMANEKTHLENGEVVMHDKMRARSEKIKSECHDISQSLRSAGRTVEGLGAIEFQPCNPWTRAISGLTNFQNIRGLHLAVILYELADMVTYRSEEEQLEQPEES